MFFWGVDAVSSLSSGCAWSIVASSQSRNQRRLGVAKNSRTDEDQLWIVLVGVRNADGTFNKENPFKPRPVHPELECGTEWIPKGLEYRPYHPDFEKEVVWDGMDERKFKCSATLELYLNEFHRDMAPLMTIELPPLHSPESISEIRERVLGFLVKRLGGLPQDALNELALPETPIAELTEDEKSAFRVMNADMLSMRSELIELKVWASMYSEIDKYLLVRRPAYLKELRRRYMAAPLTFREVAFAVVDGLFGDIFSRYSSNAGADKEETGVKKSEALLKRDATTASDASTTASDISPPPGLKQRPQS
ncbi:hypothetical protein B0H16DRAFT_1708063 [Mycena metata]|uniref:Uncharacterized protein n=1 Tax=Mycena metata TaxID=1033252 RepID=A0AAD7KHE5_9AGAR|nr:hypothetical protein B0H16DRAFT_1708063 [Mycena metata]